MPSYNYPPYTPAPQTRAPVYQPVLPQPAVQPVYQDNSYPVIKGRPVSSFEEARASMIDFDGSVFYFPDLANQKIYTKQINMDGTPSIKMYELVANPEVSKQQQEIPDLITREEFDKTVESLMQQIVMLKNAATPVQPPQESVPHPAPETPKQEFNF